MPTGKNECFGAQSREPGIKQMVNTCITPGREKKQPCIDWLIEQHKIGRLHIIELSKQIASGFEKSISQHTSTQKPLQQTEILARDNEFLINIQWLLENWGELISTINKGAIAIDGRLLTDTTQLFEVEFQRMATAIQIYISKTKAPQIKQVQLAATKLKNTLASNPIYPTPDLIELGKMLDLAINSISPAQFQQIIIPLRTKIASIQKWLSNQISNSQRKPANIEQFYIALTEALGQLQAILLSIKDDPTDQMLLVMKKLQVVTEQMQPSERLQKMAAMYFGFITRDFNQDLATRLTQLELSIDSLSHNTQIEEQIRSLVYDLIMQEQSKLKQSILVSANERFTTLTRNFNKEPAMRLVDITIAQAMLPKKEELSQQKPMTTETLITIELINLLDEENVKTEKLVVQDDRTNRHFRKMSYVMQQNAAGQQTEKADEELLRLLQNEKIRLEGVLKIAAEEFALKMEEINKIKNPHQRLMKVTQEIQELGKPKRTIVTSVPQAHPKIEPPPSTSLQQQPLVALQPRARTDVILAPHTRIAARAQQRQLMETIKLSSNPGGVDELDELLKSLTDDRYTLTDTSKPVVPAQQKAPSVLVPKTKDADSLEPSPQPLMFTPAPELHYFVEPEAAQAIHHSRSSSSFTSHVDFAKFAALTTQNIRKTPLAL